MINCDDKEIRNIIISNPNVLIRNNNDILKLIKCFNKYGFTNLKTKCCDVFDLLRSDEIKNKYDCIILDPPAFTKSKDTIKKAYKGYKEINLQAIKAIKSGGYLLTFSCSQHMTPDLFLEMIKDALADSKRKAQFIEFKVQSPDHPSLFSSEEQLYLKCVILRII